MKNIKRWITALCVISLAGTSLAACGSKKEQEPAVSEATATPEATPEEKTAKLITKANDENTLIEKYGSIGCKIKMYSEDKTVENAYAYHAKDYFYSEQGAAFVVDDGGDVYGFDDESDPSEYRCLFVGDSYEEYRSGDIIINWDKDCEEDAEISEKADEDGLLKVEFVRDISDDEKAGFEDSGYENVDKSKLYIEFMVDEVSYEITEVKWYLRGKDKKDTLVQEAAILFDEEKPEVEKAYLDRVFSEDFRKVQVVVDPGSPKEQTYTQTVGKGCAVLTMLPSSYDQNLYGNAACTKKFKDDSSDHESDLVLYALSVEGGHGSTAAAQQEDDAADDGSVSQDSGQDSDSGEEEEETAQCPYCGKHFSVDDSNGSSDYQIHVELEQRLETAAARRKDQPPLQIVGGDQYADQCPWCRNWYSTESDDGVTSDYVEHVRWEKEYETVYNALH